MPLAIPLRDIVGFRSVFLGKINSHCGSVALAEIFGQYIFADLCPILWMNDWSYDLELQ